MQAVIQRLVDHTVSKRSVADNANDIVVLPVQFVRFRKPETGGDRAAAVSAPERIVFALRPPRKTGKPVFANRFPDSPIAYQIPTLEEEFYQVQGLNKSTGNNVGVYVEVKEPDFFMNQGLDILKATIDMLTKFGYNSADSKAILQIFDYEAVLRARELGWKGQLCMLVTANGQGANDDKARHKWLTTPEGIKEVAKYATIYAPNFNLLAVPTADGKGYTISNLGDMVRQSGMKLHSWTLRKDSLPKGFKDFNEVLDVSFKKLKVEGMFSDFPDLLVQYLKANNLR